MAWSAGPGELTSIVIDGATVTSDLIDGYSVASEKDNYGAAIGHPVDRGSILKRVSFNNYDVSTINALHGYMTGRTEKSVVITYADAATQTLNECIVRVTPLLNNVTDTCKVWFAASGTANTSLTSNWTSVGVTLDVPTVSYNFPFDGTDGCGRPYFSTCGFELEFHLPGAYYGTFTEGGQCRIALALPDGNFQVFDGRSYINYADDDGSRPRAVRVVLRGVSTSWGSLIEFTDGGATPVTEDFNAASPTLMQDRLHGVMVEAVGFGYAESDVTTF